MFSVATHNEGYLEALRESCDRHHFKLNLIGWEQKWQGWMWRLNETIAALQKHAATMGDDDVVCVVDGYDVLILADADELQRRYVSLTENGKQVVFAVENPLNEPVSRMLQWVIFGACGTAKKPLNAGVYVGPAKKCHMILSKMAAHGLRTGQSDDQIIINTLCGDLLGTPDLLAVDLHGDLIFNATCRVPIPGIVVGNCDFGLGDGFRNPRTGRVPCILHAPGGLSMGYICRRLKLPPGIRRNRWLWLYTNFKRQIWTSLAVLMLLILFWWTWKRRKPHVSRLWQQEC